MSKTVPEGWQIRSIGDLVTLHYGKSPKDVVAEGGKYPVIGTGGVTGYASSYLYDGCTTVIGRKGTINKPSYVEGKFWAIDTTYFGTGYKAAEPKWFYYSLNSFDLSKYNEASGVPSLGRDTLNAIPLLTPPLPEQQKIAAILSSVDELIEKTRAQIDKLKDLKTSMMQEFLTKGIGHTEFKDSPVGRIPEAWSTYSAKELLSRKILLRLQDGNHGSQYPRSSEFVKHGVPYIAASHISEFGEIDFSMCPHLSQDHADRLRIRPAQNGDVILTHNATVGRTAIIPDDKREVIASTSTTYYRTDPTKLLNRYLVTYFQSTAFVSQLQAIMGQTTRNQVPITAQRELQIVLPPFDEQVAIATAIESITTRIKVLRTKFDHLKLAKKALMQDLLTGKVRVKIDQKESAVA